MVYQFRADSEKRIVPNFNLDSLFLISDILDYKIQEAGFEFKNYKMDIQKQIQKFHECSKDQCILGFKGVDDSVKIGVSMLKNSSSLVITLNDTSLLTSKVQIEELKKMMEAAFIRPDSIEILEYSQGSLALIRGIDRSKRLSSRFGSGAEWYKRVSRKVWERDYSPDVMLKAPTRPKLLPDGSFEWYTYDDFFHFDFEKVLTAIEYFGRHRKKLPV